MEDRQRSVAALLHEAAETHHVVFRITDGEDPDWATWYSWWLTSLSELGALLGTTPARSELTWRLVGLDREYVERSPSEPWEDFYAKELLRHFGSGTAPEAGAEGA